MRWCVSMAHVCIDVLISVCAVSASAHARSIHVCALANADTLSLSLPLCLSPPRSCTPAHSLFVSLTLFSRARTRALLMCARARTLADPLLAFDGSEDQRSLVESGLT